MPHQPESRNGKGRNMWSLEKEKRILAKTYFDRMDVYRSLLTKDPDTGETMQDEVLLYENRPCALSVTSKDAPDTGTILGTVQNQNVIFSDPELICQENDRIILRAQSGQVYKGRTGMTYVAGSHGETVLKVEKMA